VRKLQRQYLTLWAGVVGRLRPEIAPADRQVAMHAVFGLLNSTAHSTRSGRLAERARNTRCRSAGADRLRALRLSAGATGLQPVTVRVAEDELAGAPGPAERRCR
jgi:hypothetical protein